MKKTEYDYYYQDLSVSIFTWAESQVMRSHLPREYFDDELRRALHDTRSKGIDWLPIAETYKGKSQKRKGTVYVAVQMGNGQSYGFYFPEATARKIDNILRSLWAKYIHGDI